MHRSVLSVVSSLLGVAVLLIAGAASARRAPPADVPPVVSGGVRFEAPHFGNPCGQSGGCVVARDDATGAQQWAVKVYCTSYSSGLERDVQDVFITALAMENGSVAVTDEKGRHFLIDVSTQAVSGDSGGCGLGGCSASPGSPSSLAWLAVGALGLRGRGLRSRARSSSRAATGGR